MATYPATNSKEASELLIDGSNQVHEVVNGDATTEVTTESGPIPSLRKAISDTFLFQDPIAWSQGSDETAFNQLRTFDNNIYWAPSATLSSPVPMGTTPIGDNNWKLAPVDVSREWTLDEITEAQNEIVGGSIFKGSNGETVEVGDVVEQGITHLRVLVGGEPTIVAMSPVASGVVNSLTDSGATIGPTQVVFKDRFYNDGLIIGDNGKSYRIVSCVLRQDSVGSGWYVLNDSGHIPVGLDLSNPIYESNGNIVLNYAFSASKVGSLIVTPDETFAATPLTVGSSVGINDATISLYYPFEARIAGLNVAVQEYLGAQGVDWDYTYNVNDGTYTFTHPAQLHSDSGGSPVEASLTYDGNADSVGVLSATKTGFTIQSVREIAGRVNLSLGVSTNNAGTTTASWTNDTLTINHPLSTAPEGAFVVTNNPAYSAAVVASTTTSMSVTFFDIASGTAYSGANPPCQVRYFRAGLTPSVLASGLDIYVRRGPVKVDSKNVSGTSANLWVYGVFEV